MRDGLFNQQDGNAVDDGINQIAGRTEKTRFLRQKGIAAFRAGKYVQKVDIHGVILERKGGIR